MSGDILMRGDRVTIDTGPHEGCLGYIMSLIAGPTGTDRRYEVELFRARDAGPVAPVRIVARGSEMEYLPDTTTGIGVNGHRYEYTVLGRHRDGSLQTSQWDARHRDNCPCYSSQDW